MIKNECLVAGCGTGLVWAFYDFGDGPAYAQLECGEEGHIQARIYGDAIAAALNGDETYRVERGMGGR